MNERKGNIFLFILKFSLRFKRGNGSRFDLNKHFEPGDLV